MKQIEAARWRARAESLRRAAAAIDEMVDACADQTAKRQPIRARILAALTCAESLTLKELLASIGTTRNTLSTNLCRMTQTGDIERVGYARYSLPKVRP